MNSERPKLNDIALFVEVAKRLSFSRAAELLGMPNSSLSRRITELERALGASLLNRSSRRVELTELGRRYFERCRSIVDEAEAAHEQLVRENSSPKGRIRMSVPVDFGLIFIAPALADFAGRYPDLSFAVDMSPQRVDLLGHDFDLAIRVGDLVDSTALVTRRLVTAEVALYAAPSYLAAEGRPLQPSDVTGHKCLRTLLPGRPIAWMLHRGGEQVAVAGQQRFFVNNLGMLRELTLAGMGIGAFDAVVAGADIQAGRLQRVLPEWTLSPLPISLLTPGHRLARRVRLWVEFLSERLRGFDSRATT